MPFLPQEEVAFIMLAQGLNYASFIIYLIVLRALVQKIIVNCI